MAMKDHPTSTFSLISLVIHTWDKTKKEFKVLALVSSFNPDHVTIHDDVHSAVVTGHLEPTGHSYLALKWTDPVREVGGLYKCQSNGMTIFGRYDTSAVGLRLSAVTTKATVRLVVSQLQATVRNLTDTVLAQDAMIRSQGAEIGKLSTDAQVQLDALRNLTSTVRVQDAMIRSQDTHIQTQDAAIRSQDAEIQDLTSRIQRQELITHNQTEHLGDQDNAMCALASQIANYSGLVYPLTSQCPVQVKSCRDVQSSKPREIAVLAGGMAVLCDTVTDGGGWIVFQRRSSGQDDFVRPWSDYKIGFGDLGTNFWLGNERLYRITSQGKYELRVDFTFNNHQYYARYNSFKVLGAETNYRLQIGAYSGTAGDDIFHHNNMAFSTFDADHDLWHANCAKSYGSGGWWYKACASSNLNGLWDSTVKHTAIFWVDTTGYDHSASFTEMKIRPI